MTAAQRQLAAARAAAAAQAVAVASRPVTQTIRATAARKVIYVHAPAVAPKVKPPTHTTTGASGSKGDDGGDGGGNDD